MHRLSFVIPNHDYARFLGRAIRSALDVRFDDVEVVVVDDGSTDESVEVVEAFGDRVRLITQPNLGPRIACNTGYAATTGDWIVFLDSDDVVRPGIAEFIERLGRPGVSKLQFQMQRIDAQDRPVGAAFPAFRAMPDPEDVRAWMRTTASYPTPPGSGNAYPREFLESLFPLDDRCGDATDSMCLAAAPFRGDVVTVPEPMFDYRVHGGNRSNLLVDAGRFAKHLERARQRHEFAQDVDPEHHGPPSLDPLFRGRHLLQLRVAHRRLVAHRSPLPGDSFLRMLGDCFRVLGAPGPEAPGRRLMVTLWSLSVLLSPRGLARRLVHARFAQPHAQATQGRLPFVGAGGRLAERTR